MASIPAILAASAAAATPSVHAAVLGRSAEGRPIHVARIGDADARLRVLVIGAIHGNEPAGRAIIARLRRDPVTPPADVGLWLIDDVNPDGTAAGTRQNGRGVDLNRNFPDGWRAQGSAGDTFYPGARALSEPESRLVAGFVSRLRPAVTIWYHQSLGLVDLGTVADPRIPWRYARTSALPARRLGHLPGIATRWANRALAGSSAFVVELPPGPLSEAEVLRHAAAIHQTVRGVRP